MELQRFRQMQATRWSRQLRAYPDDLDGRLQSPEMAWPTAQRSRPGRIPVA